MKAQLLAPFLVGWVAVGNAAEPPKALVPDHTHCKQPGTAYVQNMGMVDEAVLQDHIAQMEDSIEKARRTEAKGSQHRKLLEQHMEQMQAAMKKIHEGIDDQECLRQAQDVSPDERIRAMEKRMQTMQQLMDQMLKHQEEIGKQR